MASFKEIFSYMDKKYGTSTNDINYRSSDEELNLPNPVPTFISTPVVYDDNPSRFDRWLLEDKEEDEVTRYYNQYLEDDLVEGVHSEGYGYDELQLHHVKQQYTDNNTEIDFNINSSELATVELPKTIVSSVVDNIISRVVEALSYHATTNGIIPSAEVSKSSKKRKLTLKSTHPLRPPSCCKKLKCI